MKITTEQRNLILDKIRDDIRTRSNQLLQLVQDQGYETDTVTIKISEGGYCRYFEIGNGTISGKRFKFDQATQEIIQSGASLEEIQRCLIKVPRAAKRTIRNKKRSDQRMLKRTLKRCLPEPINTFLAPKRQWLKLTLIPMALSIALSIFILLIDLTQGKYLIGEIKQILDKLDQWITW